MTNRPPERIHRASGDSSYEAVPDIGVLYDAVPAYTARLDVPFYLEETAHAGDGAAPATVLEVGCGTGRILLPLARAGHAVIGVEPADGMLARCRAKLAAEPPVVQGRVTLVRGDGRDLALKPRPGGGFAVAVAAFRVLQHLTTTADQLACLSAIRRHLVPGGRLVFDVFNPNYALMTRDRSQEVEDTPEVQLPDGRYFRRTARVTAVRWVDQVSDVELIYYVRSGTQVARFVQAFPMRWYTPRELEHLLERAGFRVRGMYGDFDRSAVTDHSSEILVVAERTQP